ncbi:MAG: restriction endonuclease [Christensenellales bacterium]
MTNTKVWGIHTQDDRLFLDNGVIAIGWKEIGDLSNVIPNRDAFKAKFKEAYPAATKNSVANCVGSLYRFIVEMQIGDYVVFPSKSNREINIGEIISDYFYDPAEKSYAQKRSVKWLKHLPRTAFTQGALYEVGAFTSCFLIRNYADEFLGVLDKGFRLKEKEESIDDTVLRTVTDIVDNTKDYIIKELHRQFKGYDLENFVADLLNAMGYIPKVSKHGGDHGIDIIVYKDELPPRILVQVKSQYEDITEALVSSFAGALGIGDYGVFVTLSDFKPNALKYLENHPNIKGINGSELVNLVLKYYDKLSEEYRVKVPLKMVYIPNPSTEEE